MPARPFPGLSGGRRMSRARRGRGRCAPRPGAPNVLWIVLDDTGFGQLGCYGSPIATPNLDALAAGGLLYTNMHTTALCSPSRSCILTGRNHHANATAAINELATGYPGYNGSIPFENGFLPEMLQQHGYSTYMVGKYHLLPSEFESAAGPFDRWPLGRGFERFYGFLGGDTSQWYPDLVYDNHQVEPPRTPEDGYHLTEDLADKAIEFIADAKQVAPEQAVLPAFLHRRDARPASCAERVGGPVRGPVRRRLGRLPRSGSSPGSRNSASCRPARSCPGMTRTSRTGIRCRPMRVGWRRRMMEVFAGFLSHTDHHIGRLLDFLRETGEFDNTLIMVVSDNGASAEGGPTGTTNELQFFNNAPEPLEDSLAGDRRARRTRPPSTTTRGAGPGQAIPRSAGGSGKPTGAAPATRSWSAGRRASRRAARSAPSTRTSSTWCPPSSTCWGSSRPRRSGASPSPRSTVSASPTPSATRPPRPGTAPSTSRCSGTAPSTTTAGGPYAHGPGHRSPRRASRSGRRSRPMTLTDLDAHHWELYHVAEDPAENHDLAEQHRDKLIEMIAQWYVEAGKYNVLPIDGSAFERLIAERPQVAEPRDRYAFRPGTQTVPPLRRGPAPQPPARITADAEIPAGWRRGRPDLPGHQRRRLVVLRQGQPGCTTPTTTSGARFYYVSSPRRGTRRPASAALRVRAHRHSRTSPAGKGSPGRAQLYVDGQPGRADRVPGHHPGRLQPRRPDLRRQPRPAGHPGLPGPVPVHRHPAHRHHRPVRRPHHRHRERDADGHGPPVDGMRSAPGWLEMMLAVGSQAGFSPRSAGWLTAAARRRASRSS